MIELPFPSSKLAGQNNKRRPFSADEVGYLRAHYRAIVEAGHLDALAAASGRSKSVLAEKARSLGLTDPGRARKAAADTSGDLRRGKPLAWPHPRGMLGHTHSDETKDRLRATSLTYRASLSRGQASDIATKAMRTRAERHGSVASNVARGSWKAGWREIGGYRKYYRSRWEANYARYLQWLVGRGELLDWKHEPETFWFESIRRGVRSYLPDFRVWELDGSSKLHEVKGWMDARSKTVLKRMKKYHPDETIVLIAEKQYREIERKLGRLIEGWE